MFGITLADILAGSQALSRLQDNIAAHVLATEDMVEQLRTLARNSMAVSEVREYGKNTVRTATTHTDMPRIDCTLFLPVSSF